MDKLTHAQTHAGYYSVIQWVADPIRGEARNVAVVLVDPVTNYSGMESIAPSQLSKAIANQGIFDAAVEGLRRQVEDLGGDAAGLLRELANRTSDSTIQVSPPVRTAVTEPDETLKSLYGGLVRRKTGGSKKVTKGRAIDRVVRSLRSKDVGVRRYEYVDDFRFDVVVDNGHPASSVLEVLSFANVKQDWSAEEYQMGHFLHALDRTELHGIAAIMEPEQQADRGSFESYRRVQRWCLEVQVPLLSVSEVADYVLQHSG